jgi:hypothetical protein
MVDDVVRLGAHEVAPGRPFTDPARGADDLAVIRTMAAALRGLLGGSLAPAPRPLVCAPPTTGGRQHRAIVCDDARLRVARDLAFVGFFATKRPDADAAALTAADDELVREFPQHPGILAYSSVELADGSNWGNMIVLDPPEARDHWRTSPRHAWAAGELAPRHYTVVRLHHGVFPGGLLAGRDPVLTRTRYLDFQGPARWEAERLLGPAAS